MGGGNNDEVDVNLPSLLSVPSFSPSALPHKHNTEQPKDLQDHLQLSPLPTKASSSERFHLEPCRSRPDWDLKGELERDGEGRPKGLSSFWRSREDKDEERKE